jgi:hypothetical protein
VKHHETYYQLVVLLKGQDRIIVPKALPWLSGGNGAMPANKPQTEQEKIEDEAKGLLEELRERQAMGKGKTYEVTQSDIKNRLNELAARQEQLGGVKAGTALGNYRSGAGKTVVNKIIEGFGAVGAAKVLAGGGGFIRGNDLSKCKTGTYKDLKCPGGHKHHVVPARVTRTGTRPEQVKGIGQIPGADNINEGFSVCLSETDHKKIHKETDPKIAASGKGTANGLPNGVGTLGGVIDIAVDDLQKMYRENGNQSCADDVKKKADDHFKDQDRKKPVNTTQNPKKDLDPAVKQELGKDTGMKPKPPKVKRP